MICFPSRKKPCYASRMYAKRYFADLFHGWVGTMSGIASIVLLFLPLILPKLFVDSKIAVRATWVAAAICFVVANYTAWLREHKLVVAKESEIDRISKPDRCPIVRVYGLDESPINLGLLLQSEGETAHEVTLEEFDIEPSVTVAGRAVPQVGGHQLGQAVMLVWIKGKNPMDLNKWDLIGAFRRASDNRDAKMTMGRPNYSCTLRLTYRDHNDFWYRTTQEISFVPATESIEFGSIKHEKLGTTKAA